MNAVSNAKPKVILAYSGGLDTSIILKWLLDKGYDVIAYVADVGQEDDFVATRAKALKIGASKVYIEDLKEAFVKDYIFPMFQANALYEGRYLLGTAICRPLIAKRQIEIAAAENAAFVAHGATGKGNDQVRFELGFYALNPSIKVLAPWKMDEFLQEFKGRPDMIHYATKHDIEIKSTLQKPFSEDDNLLHISHEAGILEDPAAVAPAEVYSKTVEPEKAPDAADYLTITFKDGIPVQVAVEKSGVTCETPLSIMNCLNEMGARHGIGRIDIVENRYVGIKSRGIYETPGGTILLTAHKDIEGIAMDREVMRLRDMLSSKVAELIYNGFWFSPEMDFLMSAIRKSQEYIDGTVWLKLYKGGVYVQKRASSSSLYDKALSSMDVEGGFNQADSEGFIKINAIRLKAHHAIIKKKVNLAPC